MHQNGEKPYLHAKLEVKEKYLYFEIENSHKQANTKAEDEKLSQGIYVDERIGLGAIKKRLKLLYPGKYNLDIERNDRFFRIKLSIELK